MSQTDIEQPVQFHTHVCANGMLIGEIVLYNEKALNAQNTQMIELIAPKLRQWECDAQIALVLLRGAGEKAFCAGGDIRSLYYAMKEDNRLLNSDVLRFFSQEYGLCQQVHTYPKPVLVWASGIVMGGGMGLAGAASHRIVTNTTLMAMPEISIGLFPDAGATWFLQRFPAHLGLFVGLTGARFNGQDAFDASLAECAMPADGWDTLLAALLATEWQADEAYNQLNRVLGKLHQPEVLPPAMLLPRRDAIQRLLMQGSLSEVDAALQLPQEDDYLEACCVQYRQGCPTTAALMWQLYRKARYFSLDQALHLELTIAMHCCHQGNFQEGVRALLIDKDKQPKWRHRLTELNEEEITQYFESPFPKGEHPFDRWLIQSEASPQ